jgi:imidazolonepropionase
MRVLAAVKARPVEVIPTFLFRLPQPDLLGEAGAEAATDMVCRELLPKIRRRSFAQFADLAWEPEPARQQLFVRYLEAARNLGLTCKIHADQGPPGVPIGMAVEHSAVSIDHLEYATAADLAVFAQTRIVATLLPYASFCKGGRYAPGRVLIDAGIPVALATNFNPHHTPSLNMQTVVSLAGMRLGMTPAEAISAVTINGAHALGCADRVGSLELGKSADLIILNLADYTEMAHHFGMNLVHMTMKRGEFIYTEGEVAGRKPGIPLEPKLDPYPGIHS